MTREFKFRAWDGEEMHYNIVPWQWDFVIDTMSHKCVQANGTGILNSGGKTAIMEVPAIRFKKIMQFTGFKDKNGKEIYEGDKIGDWVEVDGKMEQSKLQVYFDEMLGQWMLDNSLTQNKELSYSLFAELSDFEYEVIGNIYE